MRRAPRRGHGGGSQPPSKVVAPTVSEIPSPRGGNPGSATQTAPLSRDSPPTSSSRTSSTVTKSPSPNPLHVNQIPATTAACDINSAPLADEAPAADALPAETRLPTET